jgi:hypothetical protein
MADRWYCCAMRYIPEVAQLMTLTYCAYHGKMNRLSYRSFDSASGFVLETGDNNEQPQRRVDAK